MAVKKLSQITAAGSPPALTDQLVGVGGGTTDLLYSLAQVQTVVPGTTPISPSTDQCILFDEAGVVGESVSFKFDYTNSAFFLRGNASNTVSADFFISATPIGGKSFDIFATGTGNSSGAGLLGYYNQTDNCFIWQYSNVGGSTPIMAMDKRQAFGWGNDNFGDNPDALLYRDASGILSQRNGGSAGAAVPQTFRIANFDDGAGNYEIFTIDWQTTANHCRIGTDADGTGAARPLLFQYGGLVVLDYSSTNNNCWATSHPFIANATGQNAFVMNSTGTFYSAIGNVDAHTWAINYGGVTTLGTPVIQWTDLNSVIIGSAAIATNATDGFLYIPTCAGTPTGTPTSYTGRVPMVFDTTNSQFWFYTGGAWKQPKTPAGAATVTWQ